MLAWQYKRKTSVTCIEPLIISDWMQESMKSIYNFPATNCCHEQRVLTNPMDHWRHRWFLQVKESISGPSPEISKHVFVFCPAETFLNSILTWSNAKQDTYEDARTCECSLSVKKGIPTFMSMLKLRFFEVSQGSLKSCNIQSSHTGGGEEKSHLSHWMMQNSNTQKALLFSNAQSYHLNCFPINGWIICNDFPLLCGSGEK